jgi:hypothetical protein
VAQQAHQELEHHLGGAGHHVDAVVAYDGTDWTCEGPTTVKAGRVGFAFETTDSTWVAAIIQLTGESTIEEVVAWVEANPWVEADPEMNEGPPGIEEVILVPSGATKYVTVGASGVGVLCSTRGPGPLLIAATLAVE